MPAKMRPTSPRGIIPSADGHARRRRAGVTRPQAHLPIIAATVMRTAKPITPGFTKFSTCTSMPMRTKKTGTRRRGERVQALVERALAPLQVVLEVDVLHDEAGGEGAHDRGEPRLHGEPGEAEAEAEGERLHDAGRAQGQGVAEEPRATA